MQSRTVDRFDEVFDVVVVGYGFGGAVAALSAHDCGAEVLLAEKMPNPGGISICSDFSSTIAGLSASGRLIVI